MLVRVRCLRNTTDSTYHYYREGHEYVVEHDHPCMKWFEQLEDVKEEHFIEQQRAERPQAPASQLVATPPPPPPPEPEPPVEVRAPAAPSQEVPAAAPKPTTRARAPKRARAAPAVSE